MSDVMSKEQAYQLVKTMERPMLIDGVKLDRLNEINADLLAEMKRFLPVLEHIENNPQFWAEATNGTGIATANAYRAAIAKTEGDV